MMITVMTHNPPSPPFRKGGTTTPPFNKGRLGGIFLLTNSKGISVLFLVIAMLLMVTIGYVFSYLIPTKQKSVRFPIYSNQAFFIAQSGVEYAIRYSSNQDWRTTIALLGLNNPLVNQRNLGNGQLTISYDNATDTLTSTGQITGVSERRIVKVSILTQFLNVLVLDTASPVPCWCNLRQRIRFYIRYVGTNSVTLTAFSATWQETAVRRLTRIDMNGVQKYAAPATQYYSGNPPQDLNRPVGSPTITINPGPAIPVLIYWSGNITGNNNIIIRFYTALGDPYTFTLNLSAPPGGSCAVDCP